MQKKEIIISDTNNYKNNLRFLNVNFIVHVIILQNSV